MAQWIMGWEVGKEDFDLSTECHHKQVTLSLCNLCFVTGALFYIPASGFTVSPKLSAQLWLKQPIVQIT